jgi:hypothetical protein
LIRLINRKFSGRNRMDELKAPGKPFDISKRAVWEAWEKVKAKQGRTRRGRGDGRGVRVRSEEQPVQDLEPALLWHLLPAAGARGRDPDLAVAREALAAVYGLAEG